MAKQMTRWDLRRWWVAVLVLVALRGAPVRADSAAAEVLIQQGLTLRREGKPEQALDKFRQAHEIAPSARTYGQMGLVEATLKRWTDSETHLSVSLSNPDDPWVRKNRAFLDQALAVCRQHVGDLVVTGPPGVEVSVAGAPAGTLPAVPALRVAEGEVEVTASAPGYEPFSKKVTIRPRARTPLDITMTRVPVAEPTEHEQNHPAVDLSPQASTPSPGRPPNAEESHWRGWTALGLGIAGVGAVAAGITWFVVDGRCETQWLIAAKLQCHTAYNTKTLGYIATGVGAAALIAGGIVLFSGPSKSDVSVALIASPTSLGLAGRF